MSQMVWHTCRLCCTHRGCYSAKIISISSSRSVCSPGSRITDRHRRDLQSAHSDGCLSHEDYACTHPQDTAIRRGAQTPGVGTSSTEKRVGRNCGPGSKTTKPGTQEGEHGSQHPIHGLGFVVVCFRPKLRAFHVHSAGKIEDHKTSV